MYTYIKHIFRTEYICIQGIETYNLSYTMGFLGGVMNSRGSQT